ncbi:putative binding protein dependent transport protein [Streptomyces scabiei 87.22]|uniref:Putative binding protein dependent transport protein n=1 Tax=Streptomyces scabiei (strain 87.22) TaxID=680198 RepID=C9Z7U9_STRSW|nr:sugar ABC transporter permease [Streptomyces scabiei]MDX3171394.1 sugar ABC transporter permease [Streptomyces scabiei]MDX3271982.1 sugar ABC transporter permease [Streptomyces scabiei]MDX3390646.1 sugar ABC transporter permease [Streptomyces scabiei]CBG75852.1 putative binding protein dependent transport protein [Streptomyces scabiei 87.22]
MTLTRTIAAGARGRRRGALGQSRAGMAFVAAYVLLLIAFGILPTGYAVYFAFTDAGGRFTGFTNFLTTAQDFRFADAVGHVAVYLVLWLVSLVVFVVGLALLLHRMASGPAGQALRFLYYIPGALAGAASVLVWLFMLDPTVSPVSSLLALLGFDTFGEVIAPGNLALLFTVIAFWTGAGGWIVVMYGALNNIPRDVMEAAHIDGAGAWQTAWHVQIPMLRKWIVYMVILAFAGGAQLFVEPQLLSLASVGVAGRDYSLNQLTYDFAFQMNNVNGAAAVSVELLVVSVSAAALFVARSGFFDAD